MPIPTPVQTTETTPKILSHKGFWRFLTAQPPGPSHPQSASDHACFRVKDACFARDWRVKCACLTRECPIFTRETRGTFPHTRMLARCACGSITTHGPGEDGTDATPLAQHRVY